MKKFDTYREALEDAKAIDPQARELEAGEEFGSLTVREAAKIIDVHAAGGGLWTWCYKADIAD